MCVWHWKAFFELWAEKTVLSGCCCVSVVESAGTRAVWEPVHCCVCGKRQSLVWPSGSMGLGGKVKYTEVLFHHYRCQYLEFSLLAF